MEVRTSHEEKWKNYSENVQEIISSYSAIGCNLSLKLNGCILVWTFFLKTWEPFSMFMAKGSIGTFPKWKRGALENVVQICWLNTVGDTNWQI
jgi:hypothetical protein